MLRGVTGGGPRGPDGQFAFQLRGGHVVRSRIVLVAPGMVWRRLDVAGVEELLGRGVYYGAGRSEAAQCGGREVVVVGAGNSAGQAVMHLADTGARVSMLVRGAGRRAARPLRLHPHRSRPARRRAAAGGLASGARSTCARDQRPGLFEAGDVRHGSIKRVGGAVGEGAMAVGLAHRRHEELLQAA